MNGKAAGPRYTPKEMLAKLVSFDTVSSRSNLELIAFVEAYLSAHDIASTRVPSPDGSKASLYASVGPAVEGGVVLSGHSDVVPVAGQPWSRPPFELSERDGRLYGRGTTDMKGFLAVVLALMPEFKSSALATPIHLAISYDEEVGCIGCRDMIEAFALGAIPRPRAVIVGEPTEMRLVVAHKGIHAFETRIRGRAAHSSLPHRGANAIFAAGALLAELERQAEAAKARAGPAAARFEPPYTSVSVGVIEGGNAVNVVPGECRFLWECRTLPGETPDLVLQPYSRFADEVVLPRLKESAADATIETGTRASVLPLAAECDGVLPPSLDSAGAGRAEALARRLTGETATHFVSYTTEGGLFQGQGFSTIVMGPGSIHQAHQADEFIAGDELEKCAAVLRRLPHLAG